MTTEFEARHADLTRMISDHAAYMAAGNERYAGFLAPQIAILKGQIAHYNPQGDDNQFLDENRYTAAMNAYAEIGECELQEAVEDEIVATFHRGEIEFFQIFADLAAELDSDGPNAALDVKGYQVRHDGGIFTMTAPTGESRSFPIPDIA